MSREGDTDDFAGCVVTRHGLVDAYSDNSTEKKFLVMRFIFDGREYCRRIDDPIGFTRKSATILAGKFAKEIAGGGK